MKRTTLFILLIALLISVIASGAAAAQDAPPQPPHGPDRPGQQLLGQPNRPGQNRPAFDAVQALLNVIASETGLLPREIVQQVVQGQSLADVITANGGDVQVIIDGVIAPVTQRLDNAVADGGMTQERADEILANAQAAIDRALNGELHFPDPGQPGPNRDQARRQGERALLDAVGGATGLSGREILSQLREGATLAEVVTASGGDIDAVIAEATAVLNQRIDQALANGRITQAQADELRGTIDMGLIELVNGDIWAREAGALATAGVVRLALERTGLTPLELRDQLQSGATLAQVLEANGVAVDGFIADMTARVGARLNVLVVDGRMSQARADELLAQFQARLTERINQAGPQGQDGDI
ncbi:MAG: hypothetical protein KJ065_05385 [Anaerolineae bacterium]|nr:hypothetical protein [Anaerolineae bacterium]